ncbi:unnamed protein product [Symbiodinium sp. CCMP2592]|nr:unnamed protein product [Symbiodinium sp. CCMP2592]
MLSVDLSRAFDQLPCSALSQSLHHAGIAGALHDTIIELHESCTYTITHGPHTGSFQLQAGVRQGCALSPLLYGIFTGWFCDLLAERVPADWLDKGLTIYADDNLLAWDKFRVQDFGEMCRIIRCTFALLKELGMSVNELKSRLVIKLVGSEAKTWMRKHVLTTKDGRFLQVGTPTAPILIPVAPMLTYLGVVVSFDNYEQQTCQFRLQAARQVRQRLVRFLHSSSLPIRLRVQLYIACVRCSMLYGIHAVGVTAATIRKLEAADARYVRAIAKSPVHLTREANSNLRHRLKVNSIPEAISKLLKGRSPRSSYSVAVQNFQHNLLVLQQLESDIGLSSQHGLMPVDPEQQIPCHICGRTLIMADLLATTAAQEMEDVMGGIPMIAPQYLMMAQAANKDVRRDSMENWEEAQKRHPKWQKQQQQKGDRGKGQSWSSWGAKDQDRDDWFQDSQSSGIDQATQHLLLRIVRMALRHEEDLAKIRIGATLLCYMDTGSTDILPQVRQTALSWQKKREENAVTSPLRVILLMSIIKAASDRISALLQDEPRLAKAKEHGWLSDGHQALDPQWHFFRWNPNSKQSEQSPSPPIANSQVLKHLANVHDRPLRQCSAVLPFFCVLSLRSEAAGRCHAALLALEGCAALKTIGMRVRPERGTQSGMGQCAGAEGLSADGGGDRVITPALDAEYADADAFKGEWQARLACVLRSWQNLLKIGILNTPSIHCETILMPAFLGPQGLHFVIRFQPHPPLFQMRMNEIVEEAQLLLNEPAKRDYMDYAEKLSRALPSAPLSTFPRPVACNERASPAESLSHAFLCARTGSMWSAVRQVAALLPYALSKRAFATTQRSCTIGAYGHRSFTGLYRGTSQHQSVCQLFNAFLMLINPRHVWTTVAVHLDFSAQVHTDRQNGSLPSMIVALSHHEGGGLWLHQPDGKIFQDTGLNRDMCTV